MAVIMDDNISRLPIRIVEQKFDQSKLKMKSFVVTQMGHLPGRISRRNGAIFNTWAFAYIADGKGTYQVNKGPVQRVNKGDLFFVWPGAEFTYGPLQGDSWEEYYINFEGNRIKELIDYGIIDNEKVITVGLDQLWIHKIRKLFTLLESGIPVNGDRAAFLLESLLFEFSLMVNSGHDHKKDKWYNILEELADHSYEKMDVKLIASRHNIAVSTLRRLVRIHTGYPLNEYIHRLRISEAKQLLVNTMATIKEVAHALRYDDVYYFSRLFKKYTGMPPKKFRDTL